jgi:hypothetical protein
MALASECGLLRTDTLATNLLAAEAAKAADDAEARARGDELRQQTGFPWIGVVGFLLSDHQSWRDDVTGTTARECWRAWNPSSISNAICVHKMCKHSALLYTVPVDTL